MGCSSSSLELQKAHHIRSEILRGNLSIECPANAKVVRIFTSSTFTDSSIERNALMSRVYPKLKDFCQREGYEFQVVDMRWGVRDEATDNHMATELCLREVKLCQRLSTGPNFVTFLSHKYGYGAFPNLIEADEFEKISAQIDNDDDMVLVNKWFKRDDNAVPPCYTFQAVSTHLPDFISTDEHKRQEAKITWNEESTKVKESVIKAAKKVLKGKELNKYIISAGLAEELRTNCAETKSWWTDGCLTDNNNTLGIYEDAGLKMYLQQKVVQAVENYTRAKIHVPR